MTSNDTAIRILEPAPKKKRARTKPPKPPKEKRQPAPVLEPIPPPPDAIVPVPRKRGRPGGVVGPRLLPCPFASSDRENPCITYPEPVAKSLV